MLYELALELSRRIRSAVAERSRVATGPKSCPIRDDEQRSAAGRKHTPAFIQKHRRVLARFKPVQKDDPVREARRNRPLRLGRQHGCVRSFLRPSGDALLLGHKVDDSRALGGQRIEHGNRKTEADQ